MGDQQTKGRIFVNTVAYEAMTMELRHMPRILALDGGGVRGLSSLLIFQRIMQEIQRLKGDTKPGINTPLPCDYFDLICGTSTGGLIAIMLGRLRMVCPLLL